MKKLLLSLLILSICGIGAMAQGERQVLADISPSISSGTVNASGFEVVISSGGGATRNCLTELTVVSDTAYTLTIYNGGSTLAGVLWEQSFNANEGITKDWPFYVALCGAGNTEMSIEVSAGSTYRLTYRGYKF